MIIIIDLNSRKLSSRQFVSPIVRAIGTENYKVVSIDDVIDVSEADRIILSGTALQDNEFVKKTFNLGWLSKCKVPTLGICAGMQLLGLIHGCKLTSELEIGMTRVNSEEGSFNAYELHTQAMDPGSEFKVLARSEKCAQVIEHKTLPHFGVLFHPEVRNTEYVERFVKEGRI